jgi:hypothetical protein
MLFLMLTMHHDCNNSVINCCELLFPGATKGRKAASWLRNLGMGQYIATNIKNPVYPYSHSHVVKFKLKCTRVLNIFIITGETLEDYPDSPGLGTDLTAEAASNILDREDEMDTSGASFQSLERHSLKDQGKEDRGCSAKRRNEDSASRSDCTSATASTVPTLPPIYHSVAKKRMSRTIVRHLDGSKENDCTTAGASISQTLQVGSFNNSGDRRHNGTVHRHDHTTLRNISTSFDPSTLNCTTCQGGHKVLYRTVEGTDVGMSNPPVFVLTDQNFAAMVPVGGGRGMFKNPTG